MVFWLLLISWAVEWHSYAHCDAKLWLDPPADLLRDPVAITFDTSTVSNIKPAFVNPKFYRNIVDTSMESSRILNTFVRFFYHSKYLSISDFWVRMKNLTQLSKSFLSNIWICVFEHYFGLSPHSSPISSMLFLPKLWSTWPHFLLPALRLITSYFIL